MYAMLHDIIIEQIVATCTAASYVLVIGLKQVSQLFRDLRDAIPIVTNGEPRGDYRCILGKPEDQ